MPEEGLRPPKPTDPTYLFADPRHLMEHPREAELLPHYDNKLDYYSPASEPDLSKILEVAGAPTSGVMLDVGCGDGRASQYATERGMGYMGVDYSSKRIEQAIKLYGETDLRKFIVGDLYETLPVFTEGDRFSLIWCCELLEHLEEPERIWELMKQLVTPGGRVVCTCPVNMPYVAHLQVYEDNDAITRAFAPDLLFHHMTHRDHFVFTWIGVGS